MSASAIRGEPGGVAEIVGGIDLGRHVLLEDQPARVGPLHGHGLHLDALQKLIAQGLGQLAARCCFGGKGRDLRILEPGHQPLAAEVRHRGHEDEHLGHHDENDGQQQQLAGKPGPIADGLVLLLAGTLNVVAHVMHSLRQAQGRKPAPRPMLSEAAQEIDDAAKPAFGQGRLIEGIGHALRQLRQRGIRQHEALSSRRSSCLSRAPSPKAGAARRPRRRQWCSRESARSAW